jgi:hypothetical protein
VSTEDGISIDCTADQDRFSPTMAIWHRARVQNKPGLQLRQLKRRFRPHDQISAWYSGL